MIGGQTVSVDLISYWKWMKVWKWYYAIFLYGAIVLGLVFSFWFLKLLYRNHREDKKEAQQKKMDDERNDKLSKSLEKSIEKILKD